MVLLVFNSSLCVPHVYLSHLSGNCVCCFKQGICYFTLLLNSSEQIE